MIIKHVIANFTKKQTAKQSKWCKQTLKQTDPQCSGKSRFDTSNPGKLNFILGLIFHISPRKWFFNRNFSKNSIIAEISFTPLYSYHIFFSPIICWECPMMLCEKSEVLFQKVVSRFPMVGNCKITTSCKSEIRCFEIVH